MFEIIVDSAANIPAELCKKYKIKVLSFVNLVNGKEMTCFEPDLTPEQERAKGKNPVQQIAYDGFAAIGEREVTGRVTVPHEQLEALFAMTPYYWKTPRGGAERLAALSQLETDISFAATATTAAAPTAPDAQ